jgi:RES domain-containing protein
LPDIGIRITDPVFRAHNPEWAWAPNSGEGARRYGGRFNAVGVAALYTSLRELTAIREVSPLGQPMQPLTLCQYEVDCNRIFNTQDRRAMATEELTYDALRCPDWEREMLMGKVPSSHVVAAQLMTRGYRGMIVTSFAIGATNDDVNVVFWDWSDTPPNKVFVVDSHDRLPRDRSSWTTSQ